MRNFMVQSYATYKGLFYWLNWTGYFSGVLLCPFATVVMFSILGRFSDNPALVQQYALGISITSMGGVLINGITQSYNYDRTLGTIQFLFVSSASRFLNFLSRSIFHYLNGIFSLIVGLLTGWAIVGLSFTSINWIGFVLAMIIIFFSLMGFAQLTGILSIVFGDRAWIAVQSLATGLLLILTGVIFPISIYPAFLQEIAKLLPVTNGLIAVRSVFAGESVSVVSNDLIREAITGFIYHVVAFLGFLAFEHSAKKSGSLDRDGL